MSYDETCMDCSGIECRYLINCLDCETRQWAYAREPTECPECQIIYVVFAHGEIELSDDDPEGVGDERVTDGRGEAS